MDVSALSSIDLARAREASAAAGRPAVALLPTGACEQHGPFLPLGCDTAIARAVAEQVDLRAAKEGAFDAYRFPPIDYSPVQTGISYAGTVSVSQDVFRTNVDAVIRELLRQGFDAVAVVNGHGINTPCLLEKAHDVLDAQFRERAPVRRPVLVVDTFKANTEVAKRFGREAGYHADWIELLLAMAAYGAGVFTPERIAAYRAWASTPAAAPSAPSSIVGIPIELRSREGVRGDPMPPEGDWWKNAIEAMGITCARAYLTVRDDLLDFRRQFAKG